MIIKNIIYISKKFVNLKIYNYNYKKYITFLKQI